MSLCLYDQMYKISGNWDYVKKWEDMFGLLALQSFQYIMNRCQEKVTSVSHVHITI